MAENKVEIVEVQKADIVEERGRFTLDFRDPIFFEGKEYNGLDLSPIKTIRGKDLRNVYRMLDRSGVEILEEVSLEYMYALCAVVCKLPLEFFDELTVRDSIRLKIKVIGFLFN